MNIKDSIDNNQVRLFFHERGIWFCTLGKNIGYEQNGNGKQFLRPVIILKRFNDKVCLIIPLTTTLKKGIHYYSFKFKDNSSVAILSQIRLIDSKRLVYRTGNISKDDFKELKEKLRKLIF
jgi:mRNA interferase MazF